MLLILHLIKQMIYYTAAKYSRYLLADLRSTYFN